MTSFDSDSPNEGPKPEAKAKPVQIRGPIPFPVQAPQGRVAVDDLREHLKKPPIEVEEGE